MSLFVDRFRERLAPLASRRGEHRSTSPSKNGTLARVPVHDHLRVGPPRGICRAIETARWCMPRDLQAGFAFLFSSFFRSREIIQREDINVAYFWRINSARFNSTALYGRTKVAFQRFALKETPRIEIPCTRGFRRGDETHSLALSSIDRGTMLVIFPD